MASRLLSSGPDFALLELTPAASGAVEVVEHGTHRTARVHIDIAGAPDWLTQARAARARGDLARTDELARGGLAAQSVSDRAWAHGLLGRTARQRGELERAVVELEQASRLHESAGNASAAVDDLLAASFVLMQQLHAYPRARAVLERAGPLAERHHYSDGLARLVYFRALLATHAAQRREAMEGHRRARDEAARLGLAADERAARMTLALELQYAGRWDEASAEYERLLAQSSQPYERITCAINWADALLIKAGREGSPAPAERARTILRDTLSILAGQWPSANEGAHALVLLADAERVTGRLDEAEAHLDEARAALDETLTPARLELAGVEAELFAAQGDTAAALEAYERFTEHARALRRPSERLRAALGTARLLRRSGKRARAVEVLSRAEAELDEALVLVPLGEGRGAFLDQYAPLAGLLVQLHLELGRPQDALEHALAARRRLSRSMAVHDFVAGLDPAARARWEQHLQDYRREREQLDVTVAQSWSQSAAERASFESARARRETALRQAFERLLATVSASLPEHGREQAPPLPGDLELVLFPLADGWACFARDAAELVVRRLPSLALAASDAELASAVLDPISELIRRNQRVHVRGTGSWWSRDVHALPFLGGPLLATASVDYPLDVPARRASATRDGAVLVVGDPSGDLPRAYAEARSLAARWQGTRPVRLLTRRDARVDTLRGLLGGAELFHYAGHGVFGGREGWESHLPLADGAQLSAADVLALPRAPRTVVLSACDAARTEGVASSIEEIGLAQTFIAAGTTFVVAPIRPVADELASQLMTGLHDGLARGLDVPSALREAQLALAARSGHADWAAFRLLRAGG